MKRVSNEWIMNAVILLSLWRSTRSEENVISFELEPTAFLYHEKLMHKNPNHRRRLESIDGEESDLDTDVPILSYHPFSSAVYSSVVELDGHADNDGNQPHASMYKETVKEHNKRVQEFNAQRHFSRYEMLHIQEKEGSSHTAKLSGSSTQEVGNATLTATHRRRLQQDSNLRGGLPPILENTNEQLTGGLYSNGFQSAPLSQGYGTHYATVWVGSPTPQRKTLIVDTGSHHTAFPCRGCVDCGEEHHTDTYFNPDQSQSFTPLQCHECRHEAKCETTEGMEIDLNQIGNLGNACVVRQSYTEGSSWTAYQVRDMFFCGGKDVFSAADPIAQRYAIQFMFGCQIKSSGLFHSQLADGIMGLSQHEAALPRVMYDQGKIQHRVFSLCFRKEVVVSKKGVSAGVLTLGGIDRRLNSSPMVYAKNLARTGWYTVYVKNVFLQQGTTIKNDHSNILQVPIDTFTANSDKGVIIDSGTTDSYLHKSMKQPFDEIWKKLTGKSYSNNPVRLTRQQLLDLPTILIQIMAYNNELDEDLGPPEDVIGLVGNLDPDSPNDVLLSIPPTHYMEYSPSKDVYTPRFYFTETRGGVIGANSLQGHDVVFDWENGRIGFAESDCKVSQSNWEGEGLASEVSEARGQDCILQPFIKAKSCYETADTSICAANSEAILSGRETLVATVDYPGTIGGFNCEEVIRQSVFNKEIKDNFLSVHCNDSGLCAYTQKCELSCKDYHELKPAKKDELPPESQDVQCGQGLWSVCLDTCSQSRLSSQLMSDGECHEVRNERIARSCHTEYCGIDDPCVIPFVVHVILAFRGISHELWDKAAEIAMIEAFAASVKNVRGFTMFDPMDVELLMTSPWSEEVVDADGAPTGEAAQVIGTKAVIEVHIHNPNAIQPIIAEETNFTDPNYITVQDKMSLMFARKHKASQDESECKSSDLFELAQKAHEIHYVLGKDDFMKEMVESLQSSSTSDAGGVSQALAPLVSNQENIDKSRVVSSWTIKTTVGGGSIYDHKLDPFPGAINFVHVSPAYLPVGLSPLTLISIVALAVMAVHFFKPERRRRREEDKGNFMNLSSMTFNPKPFEMVRRKLGVRGMRKARYSQVDNTDDSGGSKFSGKDNSSVLKNSKCRSRLNDIIKN